MVWLIGLCLFAALLYWWIRGHPLAIVLMGVVMGLAGLAAGGNIGGGVVVALFCAMAGMAVAYLPRLRRG